MARNLHKKYTESLTREVPVPAGTQSGVLIVTPAGEVGVTLTARGDSTVTVPLPGGLSVSGVKNGGAGNAPTKATVAFDGSFRLTVDGVTNGDVIAAEDNVAVFRATDGTLSLTEGADGVFVGVIDDGRIVNGIAPVKIGVIR